ncbi:MAG: hormogonium polysaccharide secretion pseudopilin HpsC [Cyanobacteria bacterium J06635_10]
MNPLKLLINHQKTKTSKSTKKSAGFTLIELLVAMILASLILTPLLTFMINIMQTERREQVKTTTEQELKTALDFIARDLEQAVYIYDADGIDEIRDELPKNRTNDKKKYFPVLVFWKRQYIKNVIEIDTNNCEREPDKCDDTFSYSLVAYYLIKDDSNSTWSKAARIGRFQISDGYGDDDDDKEDTRDAGFKLFDLTGSGELKAKMNEWESGTYTSSTPDILTLVDYIDQTKINTRTNPKPADCPTGMQQIPNFDGRGDSAPTGDVETASFHVCVDSINTAAEVYLRGNALARMDDTPPDYSDKQKNYFPQARIRVEGRGFVFTK